MDVLFIFGSIVLIVYLMKCIYNNLDKKPDPDTPPPPPTLEETLLGLLKYFKSHLHQLEVYPDRVVLYCFKTSPDDAIANFNEIKIRYCDIGFKAISEDDCEVLRSNIYSAMGITPPE